MEFLPFTRPAIDEDAIAAVAEVLRSGWITSGPKMKALEAALEARYQRPVRTFSSATAALEVALTIAGVGPGDEVITTPLSWVATANVILARGATPVFVDIDPATRLLDLNAAAAALTAKTKAIIPVDLAGLPVNRDALYALAKQHGLRVIEDAAQSQGANWDGSEIGLKGDLIAFSFHANKNMTSGEGGCLLLNNEDEARLAEKLRLQGVTRFPDGSMDVDVLGGKSNLTDIAAVLGLHQLAKLNGCNTRRRELAQAYFKHWNPKLGCELPPADFTHSNWHMFQPLLPLERMSIPRGEFIARMREAGIGVGVHYPAMHLFSLYRELGFKEGQFPHAESVGNRTITLPLFPAMSEADVLRVCQTVTQILEPVLS
jgi:hypothetical protein